MLRILAIAAACLSLGACADAARPRLAAGAEAGSSPFAGSYAGGSGALGNTTTGTAPF